MKSDVSAVRFRLVVFIGWIAAVLGATLLQGADYASSSEAKADVARIEGQILGLREQIEQARRTRDRAYDGLQSLSRKGPDTRSLETQLERIRGQHFDSAPYETKVSDLDWEHSEATRKAEEALAAFEQDRSGIEKAREELADAEAKVKRMEDLRNQGIRELQEGYYCSQCNRPASQIESETGMSFQSHLNDVSGVAIPASPQVIAKKTQEFDQKVANAKERLQKAQQGVQAVEQKYNRELSEKRTSLQKMRDDYVETRSRIQKNEQDARDKFDRENKAEVDRLEKEINQKVADYDAKRKSLEESVR